MPNQEPHSSGPDADAVDGRPPELELEPRPSAGDMPTLPSAPGNEGMFLDGMEALTQTRRQIDAALQHHNPLGALQIAESYLDVVERHHADNPHEHSLANALVAEAYEALGSPAGALPHWTGAIDALERFPEASRIELGELYLRRAHCCAYMQQESETNRDFVSARELFRAAIKAGNLAAKTIPEGAISLGYTVQRFLGPATAIPYFEEALAEPSTQSERGVRIRQRGVLALAEARFQLKDYVEAECLFDRALVVAAYDPGPGNDELFFAHAGIARIGFVQGREESRTRALMFAEYALKFFDRSNPAQFPVVVELHYHRGMQILSAGGEGATAEAALQFRKALLFSKKSPTLSFDFIERLYAQTIACVEASDADTDALKLRERLLETTIRVRGESDPKSLARRIELRDALVNSGLWKDALPHAEQVAEAIHRRDRGLSVEYVEALRVWSAALFQGGQRLDSIGLLWTARRISKALPEDKRGILADVLDDLSNQTSSESPKKSALHASAAAGAAEKYLGHDNPRTRSLHLEAARAWAYDDKPRRANEHLKAVRDYYRVTDAKPAEDRAVYFEVRGLVLAAAHKFDPAISSIRRGLKMLTVVDSQQSGRRLDMFQEYSRVVFERAEFLGLRQGYEEALTNTRRALRMTIEAGRYEERATLALLSQAVNLCEHLSLTTERETFARRSEKLKRLLG